VKKFFKFMVTVLCLVLLAGTVGAAELTVKDIPGAYDDVYDTPGFEAATGPDTFPLTGKEIVIIKNTSGSDSLVTLVSVPDDLGRTNDLSDTVPAGEQVIVGPMQRKGWRSAAGNLEINYPDGTSGIEVAVVRLKPPF
jgi:hypothetical protein